MMRIYAAMAQNERDLISERTKAALSAAKARGTRLGGDRGYRPTVGPDSAAAAVSRRAAAERAAHRLLLEVDRLRDEGVTSCQAMARALTEREVPTPGGGQGLDAHHRGEVAGADGGHARGRGAWGSDSGIASMLF